MEAETLRTCLRAPKRTFQRLLGLRPVALETHLLDSAEGLCKKKAVRNSCGLKLNMSSSQMTGQSDTRLFSCQSLV